MRARPCRWSVFLLVLFPFSCFSVGSSQPIVFNEDLRLSAEDVRERFRRASPQQELGFPFGEQFSQEGFAALVEELRDDKTAKEIHFRNTKLGNAAAGGLASALRFNTALEELTFFSSRIGDEGFAALVEALPENTHLKTLAFYDGGKIGDTGVQTLSKALRTNKTSLESLKFGGASLSAGAVLSLANALMSAKHSLWKLRVGGKHQEMIQFALRTRANLTVDEYGRAEGRWGAKSEFLMQWDGVVDLSGYRFPPGGVEFMATSLIRNGAQRVKALNLRGSNIDNDEVGLLALALRGNTDLREIDLRNTSVGASAARLLASLVRENMAIKSLHVPENHQWIIEEAFADTVKEMVDQGKDSTLWLVLHVTTAVVFFTCVVVVWSLEDVVTEENCGGLCLPTTWTVLFALSFAMMITLTNARNRNLFLTFLSSFLFSVLLQLGVILLGFFHLGPCSRIPLVLRHNEEVRAHRKAVKERRAAQFVRLSQHQQFVDDVGHAWWNLERSMESFTEKVKALTLYPTEVSKLEETRQAALAVADSLANFNHRILLHLDWTHGGDLQRVTRSKLNRLADPKLIGEKMYQLRQDFYLFVKSYRKQHPPERAYISASYDCFVAHAGGTKRQIRRALQKMAD